MHIVQALVSLNLGGSELVATELSEFAAAQDHRVTVIAADGPLGDRIRAAVLNTWTGPSVKSGWVLCVILQGSASG